MQDLFTIIEPLIDLVDTQVEKLEELLGEFD